MSAMNSEERKFLGLSFNHKKEMIFDKDCMFDLFSNFILGGFMRKKPEQKYIFLFMNLLSMYDLYPFSSYSFIQPQHLGLLQKVF